MATATAFNLAEGQKAERKLLVTAVNVGTSTSKEWEIVGAGIEEASIEFNPDTETKTDILGITETTVNKLEPSIEMSPFTIRGGSKLAFKLNDTINRGALSELAMFEVLTIEAYIDGATSGTYSAYVDKNCTITPQSKGGDATVDLPITINYSQDRTFGSVDKYKGSGIEFTATVSA